MNREDWRDPTPDEASVLRRLLAVEFPDAGAYRSQVSGMKVARDNADGLTLFLRPSEEAPSAKDTHRYDLVTGAYQDADGIKVELHLVAALGRLDFLDIMKLDLTMKPLVLFPGDDKIAVEISPAPREPPELK